MPAASRLGDQSTGHDGFPPTACISSNTSKTFVNGIQVQALGSVYAAHTKGSTTHPIGIRDTTGGSSKVFIEGKPAIRIGDPIECGDSVGEGSSNTFFG